MLTKKLLKFRRRKGILFPSFLDKDDAIHVELSQVLCAIIADSLGKTRRQIEDELDDILAAFTIDKYVGLGFKKLALDCCTFDAVLSQTTSALREQVFACSFAQDFSQCPTTHRNSVEKSLTELTSQKLSALEIESLLYSDLPECHQVNAVRALDGPQLINRYQIGLVQGLLLSCQRLVLIVDARPEARARLRQLLRQIKFFQLVAYFQQKESTMEIHIDGPLSLFQHTTKYGFQLACFFPCILRMPQWNLQAFLQMNPHTDHEVLNLSEKAPLSPLFYKNDSAYIPEEFRLFVQSFQQTQEKQETPEIEWVLEEETLDVLFDNEHYFFPDFRFVHKTGFIVYLELFHVWHSGVLQARLKALSQKDPGFSLVVGVSHKIKQDSQTLDNVHSFIFRDVIPVSKILALLKAKLAAAGKKDFDPL